MNNTIKAKDSMSYDEPIKRKIRIFRGPLY